jgi:1-acyl-sn-glycerol-3-phosphate acyltransferase
MLGTVKLHLSGKGNFPRSGPVILVSNHLNNADPLVLTVMSPRRILWMTKKEWFSTPVIGWFLHIFGIPVRRFEADLKALRRAQQVLEHGGVLGIFPEGTRSKVGKLQAGEPGASIIALRTHAPVLPIAIWGTENVRLPRDFLRRNTFHVSIGEPLQVPESSRLNKTRVNELTREIMERIAALLPERYRGVYADQVETAPAASSGE